MLSFRALPRLVFAVLLIVLPLLPGQGTGQAQPARPAAWTLLFYCAADCDLEEAMMGDLAELARAGSDDQVHILVLADRSPKGEDEEDEEGYTNQPVLTLRNWSGSKLLNVKKDRLVEVELGKQSVQGQFVNAMRETDNDPREWRFKAGDQLRPVYLQIDDEGHEKPYVPKQKETVLTLAKPGDLKIGRDAVAGGEYLLGFTVEDLAGHYDEEDIAITVR